MTVTRNTSRDWAPHYSLGPALLTISVSWKTLTSLGISRPSGTLSLLAARLLFGVLWPAEQQSLQSTQCQAAGRGSQPPSLSWRPSRPVWEVGLTCVPAVGGLCVRGRPLSPGGCGGAARGQSAGCAQSAPRHALQPHVGDADDLPGSLHPGHHVGGRRQRT